MQKLSEELEGIDPVVHGGYLSIEIGIARWQSILKRIASYEREIEGERHISREMGAETVQLKRELELVKFDRSYLALWLMRRISKDRLFDGLYLARKEWAVLEEEIDV